MSQRFTNKLVNESSLYLRQHAHNPVNWYPWGEEVLLKARQEEKPILISIGYAACHWCHVMERESFEDEAVAAFMNHHFINIKIDREERPDLDHIYMDAVQAMTGSGGWPLHVFCTPDTRPFFGGTYFPPTPAFNRISWMDLLQRIQHAWEHKRDGLEEQAGRILAHISTVGHVSAGSGGIFGPDTCKQISASILHASDKINGGFGSAPKFPHTLTIRYLLEYAREFNDEEAGAQAELSLRKMIRGGIYDHLGGGLARYSTDDNWLVPHFEKMLYDNALLISALSMAYMFTADEEYAMAINKTIRFLQHELRDASGGYYSALDADSEGEEGKYYVWKKAEVDRLLEAQSDLYCRWYGISEEGNWEGNNILQIIHTPESFAGAGGMDVRQLKQLISSGDRILLEERSKRSRPLTDDKILLGWNALLISAYCRAYSALGNEAYRDEAVSLATFIFIAFEKDNKLFHSYYQGIARQEAFLDDIAYLTEACILLQEITGDQQYLQKAEKWICEADKFFLLESGYYSYTDSRMKDLLFRKTEFYDGAMPSGNSTMAFNLYYMSRVLDKPEYGIRSEKMISGLGELIKKFPVSFSLWASLIIYKSIKNKDLIITGENLSQLREQALKMFLPGRVIQTSDMPQVFPLFKGKKFTSEPSIYLCINSLCLPPINNMISLRETLERNES